MIEWNRRSLLVTGSFGLGFAMFNRAFAAPSNDVLMMQRLSTVPKTRPWPVEWFQPQAPVKGPGTRMWKKAAKPSIAADALQAARDYAAARGSQAYIVWRNGMIEDEIYTSEATKQALLNSYYMHFTALTLLMGQAIADGHIDGIDAPAARWLTEWQNDERRAITLRHLLTMTSGLEMYFDSVDPADRATRLFFGSDSTTPAFEYKAAQKPGTTFEYNYLVPELLGIVIARAVKKPYHEYLSERLWAPLGNANASVWMDREGPGARAHNNAALFARAGDWLNIGVLIARGGMLDGKPIVPKAWIETMKTPTKANPNYGMIWIGAPYVAERFYAPSVKYTVKSSAPYAADDLIFVDGYGGQRVYIVPSKDLVIVRIGESRRNDWDDAVLPNAILDGLA